ncbi:hypothetical protein FRUB_08408 [Fimbriiglobus ruber]|uniref:Uncharacterized protein n=1 Tax=Fimbriiglobus ruber TaxID=1908690 RepID=A0A225DHK0_9BACT|nr:hypothetical protein FRUB_08408 [Fimbriiglobus ruber]
MVLGLCPKPRWRDSVPPDLPTCSRSGDDPKADRPRTARGGLYCPGK